MKRPRKTVFDPWRRKNRSDQGSTRSLQRSSGPQRSSSFLPPVRPTQYPRLSPMIAAAAATAITPAIGRSPREAKIDAAISAVSPGSGTPPDSNITIRKRAISP